MALAVIIRLVTLPYLLPFTSDEAYILYIVQTIIKNFHVIWIGVSALGFDFYMGPFLIYIIYPFMAIFKGDPIVWGVISSLLGVLTVYLLYWFGKKLFSENVGLIAAIFYATSSLIIFYDQKPYPSGVPLLSLILVITLYMSKYSNKWWVLFAIAYGIVFHIHLSLTLILFVAIYWIILQRKLIDKKTIFLSIAAFILTIFPLIVFDYFHKGSNITAPLRVLESIRDNDDKLHIGERFNSLTLSMGRVAYLDSYKNNADEILHPCIKDLFSTISKPNGILSVLIVGLFLYFFAKTDSWLDQKKRLLLISSLTFLLPFIFLSSINSIEYYLLGFFPLLFLILAYIIESLSKPIKYLAYILILIIAWHGIFTVLVSQGDFGINAKKSLIKKVINTIGESPYNLKQEGGCHKYGGWRYLFSVYGRKPEQSSEDPIFSWLYPDEVSQKETKYSVVIYETRIPVDLKGYKFVFQEGGYTAYIF